MVTYQNRISRRKNKKNKGIKKLLSIICSTLDGIYSLQKTNDVSTHDSPVAEEKWSPFRFNAEQWPAQISQNWNDPHNPTRQFSIFFSFVRVDVEYMQQRKVSSHTMSFKSHKCTECAHTHHERSHCMCTIELYLTICPICNCPTEKFENWMEWNWRNLLRFTSISPLWSRSIIEFTLFNDFCCRHCCAST